MWTAFRGVLLVALVGCAHAPIEAPSMCPSEARHDGHNLLLFHDNDLGYPFTLREIQLELDGAQVLYLDQAHLPGCSRNLRVFSGQLPDGNHVLTLRMRFDAPGVVVQEQEHNAQDVLVESDYAFLIAEGRNVTVRARAFLEDLPERKRVPNLQFLELHLSNYAGPAPATPMPAAPPGAVDTTTPPAPVAAPPS